MFLTASEAGSEDVPSWFRAASRSWRSLAQRPGAGAARPAPRSWLPAPGVARSHADPAAGVPCVRRWTARFLFLLGMALAGPARAQSVLTPTVALSGGISIPLGDSEYADAWNAGYGFAAALFYRIDERWNVGAEVGYYRHRFDSELLESEIQPRFPDVSVGGNDSYVLPVTVFAELNLIAWGTTKPYVSAGIGYFHAAVTEASTSGPGSAQVDFPRVEGDSFGARVGVGVRTPLAPGSQLFVDASLHLAFETSLTFLPIRAGVRF